MSYLRCSGADTRLVMLLWPLLFTMLPNSCVESEIPELSLLMSALFLLFGGAHFPPTLGTFFLLKKNGIRDLMVSEILSGLYRTQASVLATIFRCLQIKQTFTPQDPCLISIMYGKWSKRVFHLESCDILLETTLPLKVGDNSHVSVFSFWLHQ